MTTKKKSYLPEKSSPRTAAWLWANDEFQDRYPALFELLASGLCEGESRKGATVTLFCVDGKLKACVADRHTQQAIWITLEAAGDCVAEIEAAIQLAADEWKSTAKNGAKPPF